MKMVERQTENRETIKVVRFEYEYEYEYECECEYEYKRN